MVHATINVAATPQDAVLNVAATPQDAVLNVAATPQDAVLNVAATPQGTFTVVAETLQDALDNIRRRDISRHISCRPPRRHKLPSAARIGSSDASYTSVILK